MCILKVIDLSKMAVRNSMDIVRCVGLLALMLVAVQGMDEIYSNSHISPHSVSDDTENLRSKLAGDITSGPGEILTSESKIDSRLKESENLLLKSSSAPHVRIERSANPILSRTSGVDDLLATSKNVAESLDHNDVELSARTVNQLIHPTRTFRKGSDTMNLAQTNIKHSEMGSGEGRGAPPKARSIPLSEPQELVPSATTGQNFATQSPPPLGRPRQANPDIQDIITGIVKLLNGNVNVQANTAPAMGGRPLRPQSTRINNRGPPRISDAPTVAQPDFDVAQPLPPPPAGQMTPPSTTTRQPTPYPFEKPPSKPNTPPGRPFLNSGPPDHIIPLNPINGGPPYNQRPGFHRPMNIPPWNRPHPNRRPGPNRRPIPPYMLPPFKPEETISLTSESPEDVVNLQTGTETDSEVHTSNSESNETGGNTNEYSTHDVNEVVPTTTDPEPQPNEADIKESMEFEKNKEKSSSKMEKHTSKTTTTFTSTSTTIQTPVVVPSSALESTTSFMVPSSSILPAIAGVEIASKLVNSTTSDSIKNSVVTTEDIIVPSSTQESLLAPSSTMVEIVHLDNNTWIGGTSTGSVGQASPVLETSIPEIINTLKDNENNSNRFTTIVNNNLPTEKLPTLPSTSITGIVESVDLSKEHVTTQQHGLATNPGFSYHPYKPRPGIVLDDTEFKPGGVGRPIITARPPIGQIGEIFDVTVSAIQGPNGGGSGTPGKPFIIPVKVQHGGNEDVITAPTGEEGFVSIDGKRTYLNLFGEPTAEPPHQQQIAPTSVVHPPPIKPTATGYAVPETEMPVPHPKPTPPRRPLYGRPRPSQPPVRIDTCIVGDDSTCDATQHEFCKTESGVSACHCRPGFSRRKHRDPCRRVVSVLLSLRVDRLYERRVVWANELGDQASESYQQLSYETERAIDSAMSMTPFSDDFLSGKVNSIYKGDRSTGQNGVFVNLTLQLEENAETARPQVRADIQKHLLGVIQRRNNNVGNSALWVDSPPGAVSGLEDVDECSSADLHDCHSLAKCINIFGGFKCECSEGLRDPWGDNRHRAGRFCEQCSPAHCNNRGECKYDKAGQQVCVCAGNYYGAQCEVDGEVLGVAIGASVAAIIIIGLTLVCLVMWSRRWSREQKGGVGSPVFGYMATAGNTVKTPPVGGPPYQVSLEDRLRWAQIADVMAQSNHYAPEPVMACATRPSSAMFGYPTMSIAGTLQHGINLHGTLPPIPLPRLGLQAHLQGRAASIHGMRPLDNSSSSEEEDRADLLGRNFQVPRPKSRSNASIANQSGIYYDVDYDQKDIYNQGGTIPMSTYTIGRPPYYRS